MLWEDQTLWYGTWPAFVSTGEQLAAVLIAQLQAAPQPVPTPITEPRYTVLLGQGGQITQLPISPAGITTEAGFIALDPAAYAQIESLVKVRPLQDRQPGEPSALLARARAYVATPPATAGAR